MASTLPLSSIAAEEIRPDLEGSAMAILCSSHKVGNTKPQARSFDELLSRIGQRSQLAMPKYEPSNQLAMAQV
jgi:hypothetical protein